MARSSRLPDKYGHKPDCVFTDNHGPSCDCDGLLSEEPNTIWSVGANQVTDMMQLMGWKPDDRSPLSFSRNIKGEHWIYVGRVHSGWQYKWIKQPAWTILEVSSFATITHALNDLWTSITERYDQSHKREIEFIEWQTHLKIYTLDDLKKAMEARGFPKVSEF